MTTTFCFCGWQGENFKQHYKDMKFSHQPHVEMHPLFLLMLTMRNEG